MITMFLIFTYLTMIGLSMYAGFKILFWIFRGIARFLGTTVWLAIVLASALVVSSAVADTASLFLAAVLLLFLLRIARRDRGSRNETRQRVQPVRTEPVRASRVRDAEPARPQQQPVKTVKNGVLTDAYRELEKMRRLACSFRNETVRADAIRVVQHFRVFLDTLRENPDQIQEVRQFWNYYLPSTCSILQKYDRLERSGVADPDMTGRVRQYLNDVDNALDSVYGSLFDEARKSLDIEMDALTLSMQREGLVREDEVVTDDSRIRLAI